MLLSFVHHMKAVSGAHHMYENPNIVLQWQWQSCANMFHHFIDVGTYW